MSITVKPIPINELHSYEFVIADYQRGYRWETEHVLALLEDIKEFMTYVEKHTEARYCLQPIIVRKKVTKYEVIDGQQRLTTINIIHRCLQKKAFSIEYIARPSSKEFLSDIVNRSKEYELGSENIDFYYMREAFNTILKWFDDEANINPTFPDEFYIFLGKKVDVIWYEDQTDDSAEKIFSRLNNGKILLTDAELVKALFLCDDNNSIEQKKQEIALEWDVYEKQLQHDNFWYFINGKENLMNPRVEYLLDTVSAKKNKTKHHTFDFFNKAFKDGFSTEALWGKVKFMFLTLEEWYLDIETYHYIGFLFAIGSVSDISTLVKKYSDSDTKLGFKAGLKKLIYDGFIPRNLFELTYTDDYEYIKKVLLLFNVLSYMRQDIRFPFENYVLNNWSLEHIHAQNSKGLSTNDQWESWINEHVQFFQNIDNLKYREIVLKLQKINFKTLRKDSFEVLFNEITEAIKKEYGIDLHSIDNLALLDKDTNSALNNDIFDIKRKKIIERDKNGAFIPLCTRNVFLKYYNEELAQGYFWSEEDRSQYKLAIRKIVDGFVPKLEDSNG